MLLEKSRRYPWRLRLLATLGERAQNVTSRHGVALGMGVVGVAGVLVAERHGSIIERREKVSFERQDSTMESII
jgi:NAD/NADP transhydrogenase alpha subunit